MKVTAARIVRVLQIISLLILIAYLWLVGYRNANSILLPFLIPLPTAWTLAAAILFGFLIGYLTLWGRVLRLNRQNRGLHQRLIKAGLEAEPMTGPQTRKRGGPPSLPRT